jgi:hypothetical protein
MATRQGVTAVAATFGYGLSRGSIIDGLSARISRLCFFARISQVRTGRAGPQPSTNVAPVRASDGRP